MSTPRPRRDAFRVRSAVLFLAAVLVGTGCGSESSSWGSPRSASAATTCCLATAMTTEAGDIESAAVDLFGEDYAGLGLVDDELVLFTTGTFPAVVPDALEGVPIRCCMRFDLTQLQAFALRLSESADELWARGVRAVVWGADPATNSLRVGVTSDVTQAEAALRDTLGGEVPLTVYATAPVVISTG
jgi:hypothetical protein